MAGIYIHIPFCRQACYYCNFHFSTSLDQRSELIAALVREIELRNPGLPGETTVLSPGDSIRTLYFGGGTPSLLSPGELGSVLSALRDHYNVSPSAEITLEANPDDIHSRKLAGWREAGINRLSIGIQSFIERDLKWMNRAHDAGQALEAIGLAQAAGFNNFSIDLIFGTPGLTMGEWKENIQRAIDLKIPHISSYALTVEPKTALKKMISLKKKEDVNTDEQAAQYRTLMQMMRGAGYEHYEISSFALEGFRSRHNSSYWKGEKYLGIGPSAHSYNGRERFWNKDSNSAYIRSLQQGRIPFEKEILTENQQLEEYIMTSLRTSEGMDLGFIESHFSGEERTRIENLVFRSVEKKNYTAEKDRIVLTDEGKLFADGIAVRLFR